MYTIYLSKENIRSLKSACSASDEPCQLFKSIYVIARTKVSAQHLLENPSYRKPCFKQLYVQALMHLVL